LSHIWGENSKSMNRDRPRGAENKKRTQATCGLALSCKLARSMTDVSKRSGPGKTKKEGAPMGTLRDTNNPGHKNSSSEGSRQGGKISRSLEKNLEKGKKEATGRGQLRNRRRSFHQNNIKRKGEGPKATRGGGLSNNTFEPTRGRIHPAWDRTSWG